MWRSQSQSFSNVAEPVRQSSSASLQGDDSLACCKVFVSPQGGKFPDSVTCNHLQTHFRSEFGKDVVHAFISRNKNKVPRGFGSVKFISTAVAQKAITRLSGTLLLGLYPLYIGFKKDPSVFLPISATATLTPARKDTPFQCPLEQALYLKHLFFESFSLEGKSLMKVLPADVLDKKEDYIYLCGTEDDIQSSCQMLERFLSVLKHCSLSYNYSMTFLTILQEHFITPIKDSKPSVTCLVQVQDCGFPANVTVNIYSQESKDIDIIYEELKALQPESKTFDLCPESEQVGRFTLQNILFSVSSRHRTLSEKRRRLSLVISGFSAHDIEGTWREIKTEVDSLVIVTRKVPINAHQLKYLQAKHASLLSKVQTECEFLLPDLPESHGSTLEINVKGKIAPVTQAVQNMKLVISACHTECTLVQCPVKHCPMWQTRWDSFVADQKRDGDVLIEYAFNRPLKTAAFVTVSFTLYGGNIQAIQKTKQVLVTEENGQCTQRHTFKLSEQHSRLYQVHCLDLQQLFKDSVYLESNMEGRQVIITAPSNSTVDLKRIELEMKTHFSKLSPAITTSTVHSSDRAINYFILKFKIEHLKVLNDSDSLKTKIIQKTGGKLVFQLEGDAGKVRGAKLFIERWCSGICDRKISTTRLSILSRHVPIFSSARFSSCASMIEKELGVTCYYHSTHVVDKIDVQCSGGSVCTVQLCKGGSIMKENVDAVIIPTDVLFNTEAFKETEELVKATELEFNNAYSEYLSENRAPSPGDAIKIDCGNLPFQSLISIVIDKYRPSSLAQALQKAFKLACESKFGSLSVISMRTAFPDQSPTKVVLEAVDNVIRLYTSMHTVRVVTSPTDSLDHASKDFNEYRTLRLSSALSSTPGSTTMGSSNISLLGNISAGINSRLKSDCLTLPAPCAHRVVTVKYKWQWQDDNGLFNDYSQDLCDQLTLEWNSSPVGGINVVICKRIYSIDFNKMTQTNVRTRVEREIKRIKQTNHNPTSSDEASIRYRWLYEDDSYVYSPYSTVDSSQIEQMYQGKLAMQQHLRIGRWTYMFDFQQMKQINTKTNRRRNVKRELIAGRAKSSISELPTPLGRRDIKQEPTTHAVRSSATLSVEVGNENEQNYIGLRGLDENIKIATQRIQRELQSLSISKLVSLPSTLAASGVFQSKLDNIIHQNKFVDIKMSSSSTTKGVTLEGEEQKVFIALTEIQSEIINFSDDNSDQYPEEWAPQSNTCELIEVSRNSREWTGISSQFSQTMPDNEIMSIKRVQNQLLWEKYQNSKKLRIRNGGSVNEIHLFHGSRNTCADDIAHSEEGFDMRFSSSGMWGQANYFAVKASYSDTYAYQHSHNQTKEMFLVKVLTGDSITLPSDKSLRMPPEKSQQTGLKQGASLKQVRYDSVNGTTHGSVVYMTYSNDRAYPAHVITYRRRSTLMFQRLRLAGYVSNYNI